MARRCGACRPSQRLYVQPDKGATIIAHEGAVLPRHPRELPLHLRTPVLFQAGTSACGMRPFAGQHGEGAFIHASSPMRFLRRETSRPGALVPWPQRRAAEKIYGASLARWKSSPPRKISGPARGGGHLRRSGRYRELYQTADATRPPVLTSVAHLSYASTGLGPGCRSQGRSPAIQVPSALPRQIQLRPAANSWTTRSCYRFWSIHAGCRCCRTFRISGGRCHQGA